LAGRRSKLTLFRLGNPLLSTFRILSQLWKDFLDHTVASISVFPESTCIDLEQLAVLLVLECLLTAGGILYLVLVTVNSPSSSAAVVSSGVFGWIQ